MLATDSVTTATNAFVMFANITMIVRTMKRIAKFTPPPIKDLCKHTSVQSQDGVERKHEQDGKAARGYMSYSHGQRISECWQCNLGDL